MDLRVESITHTFYNGKPHRTALRGLTFEVKSGQFTALVGPSGCGKSTLLRLAADLIQPTQGHIRLGSLSPRQARQAREIAWMAQSPALLPWLTARQNILLAQRFSPADHCPTITPDEALDRVGLTDAADTYPHTLSGGMQQRLALARLLALDASLWLMDEPFAALDEMTREKLASELASLWQPLQPTVLWVTHNIYEAVRLADRVLVFSPSPGFIAYDAAINLPRPRREDQPEFQTCLGDLRKIMATFSDRQATA